MSTCLVSILTLDVAAHHKNQVIHAAVSRTLVVQVIPVAILTMIVLQSTVSTGIPGTFYHSSYCITPVYVYMCLLVETGYTF